MKYPENMEKLTENDLPKLADNSFFFEHFEEYNSGCKNAEVLEILLDDIYIKQIDFSAEISQTINVSAFSDCVISQWAVKGDSVCETESNRYELRSKESSLYYKSAEPVVFHSNAVSNGCYMVLAIPKDKFLHRFYDDNRFLNEFCNKMEKGDSMWAGKGIGVTPSMTNIIRDFENAPYSGQLKKLYIESKIQELMVMQIGAFTQTEKRTSLKAKDKDLIHEVKLYIEKNPASTKSIVELAHMVGLNQNKLKRGFKELFDNTIFGFITGVRMEKAKHLLLKREMLVNEVADLVGYKHPQHFAAAFKRKYGFLPGELRHG